MYVLYKQVGDTFSPHLSGSGFGPKPPIPDVLFG